MCILANQNIESAFIIMIQKAVENIVVEGDVANYFKILKELSNLW